MSKTRLEWSDEVGGRGDRLLALRRDFHRHPELSHQETRTAAIIAGLPVGLRVGLAIMRSALAG
jgi:hypothetical protein